MPAAIPAIASDHMAIHMSPDCALTSGGDASTSGGHAAASGGRVVVAGVGLITPLGQSAWETFAALLRGRRLTDRVDGLEYNTKPVPLVRALGGVSIARHTATDPTVELAERAMREAATEVRVDLAGLPTWLGTSKGAVGAMGEIFDCRLRILDLPQRAIQALALGPHGYLSHHLQRRTGVEVRRHTVAACASSLTALHQARLALLFPRPQTPDPTPHYALVATAEAALLPAFIHSYRRLGVLAPTNLDDYRQNPLDTSRQGFVLSEVGAAVLLERLLPGQSPRPGQIELLDTAIANEATDLIRPSPSMDALGHVARQLFTNRHLAALHPHAPGTADHDPTELRVLASGVQASARMIGHPTPAVYANKGALGHSLGSAGLVSLVIACLAARTHKLPPMPWLNTPMPDAALPLTATPTLKNTTESSGGGAHAIFAAGFGGHVAGALIQRSQ